jgi:thymidylate synthase (FAD)
MDPITHYPLADGIGYISLITHMGNDLSVVNAARVSYGKTSEQFTDKDAGLVRYLITHQHGTPFEHITFQFRVRAPLFVVHQWERHRMASYNEESGRYIELRDDFYTPREDRVDLGVNGENSIALMRSHWRESFRLYQEFRSRGMSNELARIVLPSSLYKEFWWTVNARSLMNFLELRTDEHAQEEIRKYANAIENIFGVITPHTHLAFCDNGRIAP